MLGTVRYLLFKAGSQTTLPICFDNVSEKAADSWEELIIDAYNGIGRGTRVFGEIFHTLPILTANWKVEIDRHRAHSVSTETSKPIFTEDDSWNFPPENVAPVTSIGGDKMKWGQKPQRTYSLSKLSWRGKNRE